MPGITVGIDGSHNSLEALEWAMKEAVLRHSPLTVLTVYEIVASQWAGHPPVQPDTDSRAEELYRRAAEESVAKAAEELGEGQPAPVIVRAVTGFAASELIDASQSSDLLVVGSRGGGGFARLLLGSVASQVVHHAACPLVVVPTGRK